MKMMNQYLVLKKYILANRNNTKEASHTFVIREKKKRERAYKRLLEENS